MRASSDPIFDVTARLSYSQSCFFIFISFLIPFFSCLVVSLDVKVGEVNGDPPLGRRNDLPDAVLVAENKKDDNDDDDGDNDDEIGENYNDPSLIISQM